LLEQRRLLGILVAFPLSPARGHSRSSVADQIVDIGAILLLAALGAPRLVRGLTRWRINRRTASSLIRWGGAASPDERPKR